MAMSLYSVETLISKDVFAFKSDAFNAATRIIKETREAKGTVLIKIRRIIIDADLSLKDLIAQVLNGTAINNIETVKTIYVLNGVKKRQIDIPEAAAAQHGH
jgi:hypothetical protein